MGRGRHVSNNRKSYLEENNLIYKFRFRENHSCENAVTVITDRWINAINANQTVITIFLELLKAFDPVNHTRLLSKLKSYNLSEIALLWFNSYLNERYQRVYVAGKLSKEGNIQPGVPKGSVFDPILFLLCINDLPDEFKDIVHCEARKERRPE